MDVRKTAEEALARPVRTPEDAEAAQEAASVLAAFLRLEQRVGRLVEGSDDRLMDGEESLAGLTLHEAARQVLERSGTPLHVHQLGDLIKAGGWKHPRSRDARPDQIYFQLAARLPRYPQTFRRVAPNTFGLGKWDREPPAPVRRARVGLFSAPDAPDARALDGGDEPITSEEAGWRSS